MTTMVTLSQTAFGFYEDGTEAGSVLIGSQSTNINRPVDANSNLLLRLRIQETGGAAGATTDDFQLQYSLNGGTFTNITTSSTVVVAFNSANLTDQAATTNRLGAGTGSFVAGLVSEDGLADNKQITASNYTEFLFSLTLLAANLAQSDALTFRLLFNGATITYTVTPGITVQKLSVSHSEAVALSSSSSSTATFGSSISESVTLAETEAGPLTAPSNLSESIALTDSVAGPLTNVVAISESTTLIETTDGSVSSSGNTYNDSVTESVSLTDLQFDGEMQVVFAGQYNGSDESFEAEYFISSGASTYSADQSESITLSDTTNSLATFAESQSETINLVETQTNGNIFTASVSESISLAETAAAVASFISAVVESVALADANASAQTFTTNSIEALSLSETSTSQWQGASTNSESLTLADVVDGSAYGIYSGTVAETVALSDSSDSTALFNSAISQSITLNESLVSYIVASGSVAEAIALADSQASSGIFGAAKLESITLFETVSGDLQTPSGSVYDVSITQSMSLSDTIISVQSTSLRFNSGRVITVASENRVLLVKKEIREKTS